LKRFVSLYKKFFKNQNGPWLVITSRLENLTLEAIDLLDLIKVSLIQIGLQSTNPKTFKFFGRKLGRTEIKKKYKAIKKKCGSEILIDLILGLPQDNLQKFKESLDFTIKLKPQRIQIKQLYLNPGTRFYKEQKKYNFQVNQKRDDFRSPFVLENCSFKEKEMKEAFLYIKKVAKREKKIHWKVLTAWGNFRS
jgi:oxygen-independent coproporphyrinogen-3 oxidase